eukprot:scaffold87932_cov29-Tisochrysis_lutea.AAC.4
MRSTTTSRDANRSEGQCHDHHASNWASDQPVMACSSASAISSFFFLGSLASLPSTARNFDCNTGTESIDGSRIEDRRPLLLVAPPEDQSGSKARGTALPSATEPRLGLTSDERCRLEPADGASSAGGGGGAAASAAFSAASTPLRFESLHLYVSQLTIAPGALELRAAGSVFQSRLGARELTAAWAVASCARNSLIAAWCAACAAASCERRSLSAELWLLSASVLAAAAARARPSASTRSASTTVKRECNERISSAHRDTSLLAPRASACAAAADACAFTSSAFAVDSSRLFERRSACTTVSEAWTSASWARAASAVCASR